MPGAGSSVCSLGDDETVCDVIDNDCDGLIDAACLIFEDGFETP